MIKRTTKTPAVNTEAPAEEPVIPVIENTPENKPAEQAPSPKVPVKRAPRTVAKAPQATVKTPAKTPVKPASGATPKAVVKRTTTSPPKGSTVTPEIIEIETLDKNANEKSQAILNVEEIALEIVKNKSKDKKLKSKLKEKKEKAKKREKAIKAVIKKLEKAKLAKFKSDSKKKEKKEKEKIKKAKAKAKKAEKEKAKKGKSKDKKKKK